MNGTQTTHENSIVVNVSDAALSTDPHATIITYALGSCLGLTVFDPVLRIGGIVHCLLPLSQTSPEKAQSNPFMFVDTGLPLFLNRFFALGGMKSRMIVKVAGCGNMLDEKGQFNIGQRNHTVMRKILWKNNILIASEMVGGTVAKTMSLVLATGKVLVKTKDGVFEI